MSLPEDTDSTIQSPRPFRQSNAERHADEIIRRFTAQHRKQPASATRRTHATEDPVRKLRALFRFH